MRSTIIKVGVGIVIVLILAGIIAFSVSRSGSGGVLGGSPAGNSGGVSAPISGLPAATQVPSGDTIQIGTAHGIVTVKNFYKNVVSSEDEFLVLQQTADYEITYDTSRSLFYIDLTSGATARSAAEASFLSLLGISQADACKLGATEGPPTGSLSFCSGM